MASPSTPITSWPSNSATGAQVSNSGWRGPDELGIKPGDIHMEGELRELITLADEASSSKAA